MEEKQYFIFVFGIFECQRTHLKSGLITSNLTDLKNGQKVFNKLIMTGADLEIGDMGAETTVLSLPLSKDVDWLATVEFK